MVLDVYGHLIERPKGAAIYNATGAGLYTYETVLGAQEEVPLMVANHVIAK